MPKVVDHAQRRDEIALVACQVVARYGFQQATVARIARAAGYTTGMVAHYFESKQEIILAALRLMLLRIEQRLMRERQSGEYDFLLRLEVVRNHAGGVARSPRNSRHRGLLEAVSCYDLTGNQGDLIAALGMIDDFGHGDLS